MKKTMLAITMLIFGAITAFSQVTIASYRGIQVEPQGGGDLCNGYLELAFEPGLAPYSVSVSHRTNPGYSEQRQIHELDAIQLERFDNLCLGTYDISVIDKYGCLITLEHTMEDCVPVGFPDINMQIYAQLITSTQPGSLTLVVTPPDLGYTIHWSLNGQTIGTNQYTMSNLTQTGYYFVTVSNGCNSKTTRYDLLACTEPDQEVVVKAVVTPSIGSLNNGRIGLELPNHVPDLLSWSNGATESISEGLAAGEYCVNGKTTKGLCFSACFTVESSEFAVSHVEPSCEGLDNGSIFIEYRKSTNMLYEFNLDGLPYTPNDIPANSTTDLLPILIDGLEGGRKYVLEVVIDGISKTYIISVPVIPLEKRYNGLSEDDTNAEILLGKGFRTCNYDLYCKGTLVESGLKERSQFNFGEGDSKLFSCVNKIFCGGENYDEKAPYFDDIPAWRYRQLINELSNQGLLNPSYAQLLISISNKYGDCNRLRVCTGDLTIRAFRGLFKSNGQLVQVNANGDCIDYRCENTLGSKTFCDEIFTLELPVIDVPTKFKCPLVTMPALELQLNLPRLEIELIGFFGSNLHGVLLNENFNYCDRITFCACSYDKYEIGRNDLCGQQIKIDGDFEIACTPLSGYGDDPGIVRVVCRDPSKDYSAQAEIPDLNDPYNPPTVIPIAHQGYTFETILTGAAFDRKIEYLEKICDQQSAGNQIAQSAYTAFSSFSGESNVKYIKDAAQNEMLLDIATEFVLDNNESYVGPYGIVSDGTDYQIYDINLDENEIIKQDAESVILFALSNRYTANQVSELFIQKTENPVKFVMTTIFDGHPAPSELLSTDYLNVSYCVMQSASFVVGGQFKGTISRNGTSISTASDTAQFFATLGVTGNLTNFFKIEGLKIAGAKVGSSQPGRHALVAQAKSSSIVINGVSQSVGMNNHVIFNVEEGSVTIERTFTLSGNLQMVGIAKNNARDIAVAVAGSGTINSTAVNQGLHLLVLNDLTTSLNIYSHNITGVDPGKFNIEFFRYFAAGQPTEIILGVTFDQTAVINGTTLHSNGGKDVLILKTNLTGQVLDYWHYGSEYDENVSRILGTDYQIEGSNYIFFGGEFSSKIYQRQLGDLTFINTHLGEQKAYVTYIKEPGSVQVDGVVDGFSFPAEIPNKNLTRSQVALKTFPNPTLNEFFLDYTSRDARQVEVDLFDAFGRRLSEIQLKMENGQVFYRVSFPAATNDGIYFIVVADDVGNLTAERIVKRSNVVPGGEDD